MNISVLFNINESCVVHVVVHILFPSAFTGLSERPYEKNVSLGSTCEHELETAQLRRAVRKSRSA